MSKKNKSIILALETSCDETAAAVLEMDANPATRTSGSVRGSNSLKTAKPSTITKDNNWPKVQTLSSIVRSQIKIHKSFGGVFPEAAARAHIKWIRPVVEQALDQAKVKLSDYHRFDLALPSPRQERRKNKVEKALSSARLALSAIDYFAVTVGPGLNPSLLVGVEFAKGLSFATGKPIIPVNHLAGHLYSPFGREFQMSKSRFQNIFPSINLIVSGGHTILVLMADLKKYKVLGQTVDDAAGEAFDKIARLLGLPYPGGSELSKLAKSGNPGAIDFPRPMLNKKNYNFSFSGLKTSVLYFMRDNKKTSKKDIAASVQQAIVDVLTGKTMRATKEFKAKSIAVSGGVSANTLLRNTLNKECKKLGLKFFMPPQNLCTDNAEMIGLAAAIKLSQGTKPVSYKKIDAKPNLTL